MKNEIVIEKGIPFPAPNMSPRTGGLASIFKAMEIGDSFAFPDDVPSKNRRSYLYCLAARFGQKISVRKESDSTLRVWRVA